MHITMERQRWAPLIKDYEGGTLMECYINPNINYVEIPATIRKQRMVVEAKINSLTVCALNLPFTFTNEESALSILPRYCFLPRVCRAHPRQQFQIYPGLQCLNPKP